ncbi:RNA-binding protein 20 [Bagarius yarrelli]|uniref:RNA-binding protein 20 n=1 Tax=Bagarius yarrelli TaxID=175774 RepID=A0A556TTY5_BAGYA|nr:RNA-binding protein 20 [Bagarius yarrelli]
MALNQGTSQSLRVLIISTGSGDKFDKKAFPVGGGLSGAGQNLLLTPASLQLAQLQAQLTLQRLKLAQSSNTAAAATVLNQVLSNVAMSQPLFNQLQPQAPGVVFPSAPIAFPPPSTPIGNLVGGALSQNHAGMRPSHYGEGGNMNQNANLHVDCRNKSNKFHTGFLGATSVGPCKANEGGQYGGPGGPKINSRNNYQRDFYSSESQIQDPGRTEQWNNPNSFSKQLNPDVGTGVGGSTWAPSTHGFVDPRAELYNPEEPTGEPKFSPASGLGFSTAGNQQGFVGYPQQQKCEDGVGMTLQAHQLNDYHGITPSHLPHQCSICEKKVYNLKDWDQHVKGKLHIQNRSLYIDSPARGALHFPVASEGCHSSALNNNTMAFSSAPSQDVSTGGSSFLQAAPMKSFPLSGAGFTSHQPGTKFVARKPCPGRVVHICNLPEGSCTENDVINLGLPFGKVTNYILMRSTHQAFLEMAYVEAAQAMVQYYQLHPATINEQKLLIRMSKRYKELQLKKPGKDVESIIQDINSQREREELHETERYPADRARSRSPIARSVTPPSHSPSFTSCSSTHSPQAAPWINGVGPRRGSWDWTSRDRDEWRNGEDERRKPYLKPADERSRERYFSSHHPADEFYKKEKPPRAPQHQRSDAKFKRRDGSGDHHRSRHSESELPEDGRGRRTSRRHEREEKEANNHAEEFGNGEDPEEDCWYPKSMEELVTVDEVGEEDDSIVEPDLPEEHVEEEEEKKEEHKEEREPTPEKEVMSTPDAATDETSSCNQPESTEAPPTHILLITNKESRCAPEEAAEPDEPLTRVTDSIETHTSLETEKNTNTHTGSETVRTGEAEKKEMQQVEENQRKETVQQSLQPAGSPQRMGIEAPSPSREQEKIISEHSIPLGNSALQYSHLQS